MSDCGGQANAFKGLSIKTGNPGKRPGEWWDSDNGTQAGPTRERVNGVEGCAVGAAGDYDCVMFLPIAVKNPAPTGTPSRYKFFVTKILAFRVTANGSNKHTGTLLEDYVVTGPDDPTWCPTCEGIVVVRLTSGPLPPSFRDAQWAGAFAPARSLVVVGATGLEPVTSRM